MCTVIQLYDDDHVVTVGDWLCKCGRYSQWTTTHPLKLKAQKLALTWKDRYIMFYMHLEHYEFIDTAESAYI